MAVRILEVGAATVVPVIELHVVKAVRPTAIGNAFGLNAAEDSVELLIAYLERVMKNSVVVVIVEVERQAVRSEEHTSEIQSLMRISYAVFCLKKKKMTN